MILKEFDVGSGRITYELEVEGKKVGIELHKDGEGKWKATLAMNFTTADPTADGAAKKLGRALYLLFEEIKDNDGNFGTIDLSKVLT